MKAATCGLAPDLIALRRWRAPGSWFTVHWPDGHITHGSDRHIAALKAMSVHAPDTRIQERPVEIANGEWTSVMGTMEGTVTKPMPIGDGAAGETGATMAGRRRRPLSPRLIRFSSRLMP
jgi:hypothetical protein